MIKIEYDENEIKIIGHSQKDICASVSSILFTGAKILEAYDSAKIEFIDHMNDEKSADYVEFKIKEHDKFVNLCYETMIKCFLELEAQAPLGTVEVTNKNR